MKWGLTDSDSYLDCGIILGGAACKNIYPNKRASKGNAALGVG
jgi:hypothetical protein